MNRREFLALTAMTMAGCSNRDPSRITLPGPSSEEYFLARNGFDRYFLDIYSGFAKNAHATFGGAEACDYTVCDYADGTKLKSCCTPSGKTYVSVARMLPSMAEYAASRLHGGGIREVCMSVFRNAFDPANPNFWGYAPSNKATQLSVEAALVAWSLSKLGENFVAELTPQQRTNIQKWLASCTQVPERATNHAWFTATNQATRLQLSTKFPEFAGDEAWMIEDLKALDALGAKSTAEGWYSDSPDQPIYDIYNFYVFPNFPLMWGEIIGSRYPQWNEDFRGRVRKFLETTPYFFAANGTHPLMGRSLCYRWAVLAPLVLGYQQGLWPHSPGLLRRIVRKNLEYHWSMGCFDEERGKLRETFSRDETPVTREPYIDNGHPYWTTLGFAYLGIPKAADPFWNDKEEPLPVEKGDFIKRFDGPKFLLSGRKSTGEVRWILAQNSAKKDTYRDKYCKLTWSSHFGYCASSDKKTIPPDQAVVFRDIKTGQCATRAPNGVTSGKLLDNGVVTEWFAQLGDFKFTVTSTIRIKGDTETRTHEIIAPPEAVGQVEVLEGSFAAPSLDRIALKILSGYDRLEVQELENQNLIHRNVKVRVAVGTINAAHSKFAVSHTATP
jgi:hypothetical protein